MILVALGGVGTIGGALCLVAAFRRGQEGDRAGEQRLFRAAIAAMAAGSLLFVAALVTGGS